MSTDCECVRLWVGAVCVWPTGRTANASHHCWEILGDSKLSLAMSTAAAFHLTICCRHTLHKHVWLLHLRRFRLSNPQQSLSASHSLISNYQAGSRRSKTIAHQTWLPVPMEPMGQQMKSGLWTEGECWLLLLRDSESCLQRWLLQVWETHTVSLNVFVLLFYYI